MNTNVNADNRIEWIDAAKGIGIIFVVLGHIWLIGPGPKYISSFHMPLFFFLSGYVFKFGRYQGIRDLICDKVKHILVPYAWFSFITYGYWLLVERRLSGNGISPLNAFVNIFTCQGADQYLPHNPALWFLPCLFLVEVFFYGIARNRKKAYIPILLLLVSIAGYFISRFIPGSFPWVINVALIGVVFYGGGYVVGSTRKLSISSPKLIIIGLTGALILGLLISLKNTYVIMAACIFGDYFYFFSAAFLNILGILGVAVLLKNVAGLVFLGRNSLVIFALHFPIKRIVMGINGLFFNIPLEEIKASFLLSGLDTMITLLMLLPFIHIIRTRFSFILGQGRS